MLEPVVLAEGPPAGVDVLSALAAALTGSARALDVTRALEELDDVDDERRAQAAEALGAHAPHDDVVQLLYEVARDDESPRVRAAALASLVDVGGRAACVAVARLLDEGVELDDGARAAALAALGRARVDDAEPLLLAHLAHAAASVRLAALSSLRSLRKLTRTREVHALLAADDVRVRLLALSVLERHGRRDDKTGVERLLSDPDGRVRAMARDAQRALNHVVP